MTEIFFSTTFGGEALALAAAAAVLQKLRTHDVTGALLQKGLQLRAGTAAAIAAAGLGEVVKLGGHPSWTFLQFAAAGPYDAFALKTLFLQECFLRGVLTLGTHNVCFALGDAEIAQVLAAYGEVMPILRAAIDRQDLPARLRCDVLRPVFAVR
jgi:glutamate-1-semialdehyde 2,1-aminomutase